MEITAVFRRVRQCYQNIISGLYGNRASVSSACKGTFFIADHTLQRVFHRNDLFDLEAFSVLRRRQKDTATGFLMSQSNRSIHITILLYLNQEFVVIINRFTGKIISLNNLFNPQKSSLQLIGNGCCTIAFRKRNLILVSILKLY